MTSYSAKENGPNLVIAAGVRTPWARAGVAFASEDAGHLGARVVRELLSRTGLDPESLDEVILGSVGPPHDQANIARIIQLRAGIPQRIPARTVARNCASGIESVTTAVSSILAGEGDLYMCGGVEVMSGYPLIFNRKMTAFFASMMKARSIGAKLSALKTFRLGHLAPRVALMEGLTDPFTGMIMGSTAELLARDFGISRDDADRFALESHRRAAAAQKSGRFAHEIVPVTPLGKGKPSKNKHGSRGPKKPFLMEHDDAIRHDQSMKNLAKLRPYFEKPDGVVTVANACGITDGAAALLITTQERAESLGMKPLAKIRSWAWAGCDPRRMGLGPVYSMARALDAAGCQMSDMGAIEINEAFATQVLACVKASASRSFAERELGRSEALGEIFTERLNPNGGAIALGHPVGATGARLLLTAAKELEISDHELTIASLCIGGGQGGAVVLERV